MKKIVVFLIGMICLSSCAATGPTRVSGTYSKMIYYENCDCIREMILTFKDDGTFTMRRYNINYVGNWYAGKNKEVHLEFGPLPDGRIYLLGGWREEPPQNIKVTDKKLRYGKYVLKKKE